MNLNIISGAERLRNLYYYEFQDMHQIAHIHNLLEKMNRKLIAMIDQMDAVLRVERNSGSSI